MNVLVASTTPCPFHAAKQNATNVVGMLIGNLTNSTSVGGGGGGSGHEHHDHNNMHGSTSSMSSGGGHHGHHMMGDDDMMIMYFHGGIKDTILFQFWKPRSIEIFLLSCFILFVSAALYEGLKLLRENLIRYEIRKETEANSSNRGTLDEAEVSLSGGAAARPHNASAKITENQANSFLKRSRLLTRGHIIQTLLHMFQVTLSYLLMLVFMTYNTWLCLSVVLGAGVGYFFFGYKRLTTIDANEHCH